MNVADVEAAHGLAAVAHVAKLGSCFSFLVAEHGPKPERSQQVCSGHLAPWAKQGEQERPRCPPGKT